MHSLRITTIVAALAGSSLLALDMAIFHAFSVAMGAL